MADIIQMDSHTWRFEDGFVRFFLLEGDDAAAMIDSGMACPDALELAKQLTAKPIILINTHGDIDHASGTGAFDKIYMSQEDYDNCGFGKQYSNVELVTLADGEVIELGNRSLQIVHVPGHTKGSLAILDILNRSLYAGDTVQRGYIYMFGGHRAPEKMSESLDKLIALGDSYDRIYASHGEYVLDKNYAGLVKAAWENVLAGRVAYQDVNLFGSQVKAYTTEVCGFYM